jgi:hypothetical protein
MEPAAVLYPTIERLYDGAEGIYRGCGPNNAVCHNSREYPQLATLGSVLFHINAPCNQRRDNPREMHNLCERRGDAVKLDDADPVEIAWIDQGDHERQWLLVLRAPLPIGEDARVSIVRPGPPARVLFDLSGIAKSRANDSRRIVIDLPSLNDRGEDDYGHYATGLRESGVVGNPSAIQVGDPNRDGVFGAELGGALIRPGDPARSYLVLRLTDATAGPLMPRANCCFFTTAALRALHCWIAGLKPDGSNALEAIDYRSCPPGPPDTVSYPEPGPHCVATARCPVEPKVPRNLGAGWSHVYESILRPTCASCHHGARPAGALDLGTADAAYRSLLQGGRVVPGDPSKSSLVKRITPAHCGAHCMPKGAPPLSAEQRSAIEKWISTMVTR